MSRDRTSGQVAADVAAHSGAAVLIELGFDSGTLRLCVGPWSITVGADVYTHTGAALTVAPHGEAADGTEGLELTLSGLDAGIFDLLVTEPYQGRTMQLMEQRFDADDVAAGSPSVEFPGRMVALTSTEDPKSRTHTVTLTVEHYDADGQRPRNLRFSDAEQRRRYPGDLGAEYVASMVERVLTRNPGGG